MPNDAKFGLVVGVGLVIAVAVLFFHKDAGPADIGDASANAKPGAATRPPAHAPRRPPVKGKPSSQTKNAEETDSAANGPEGSEGASAADRDSAPVLNAVQPAGGMPELRPVPK